MRSEEEGVAGPTVSCGVAADGGKAFSGRRGGGEGPGCEVEACGECVGVGPLVNMVVWWRSEVMELKKESTFLRVAVVEEAEGVRELDAAEVDGCGEGGTD